MYSESGKLLVRVSCACIPGEIFTPDRRCAHRSAVQQTAPGSRHITLEQSAAIKDALSSLKPQTLGIATLRGKQERLAFAKELEAAFVSVGWTVSAYCIAGFPHERSSVMVVKHTQSNMPDTGPVKAALAAARIPHPEVTVDAMTYPASETSSSEESASSRGVQGLSTDTLVIVVGPRFETVEDP